MYVSIDTMMKQVQFCKKIKVRRIRSLKDIPNEDIEASWYGRQDYERARSQTKELASRLAGNFHVDVLRSRGLEPSSHKRDKHEKMRNCQLAVLIEQEQQWDDGRGVIHPRALARASLSFTKTSGEEAIRRGVIVQQQVRDDERKRTTCILPRSVVTKRPSFQQYVSSDISILSQTATTGSPIRKIRSVPSFHRWRQLSVTPNRL